MTNFLEVNSEPWGAGFDANAEVYTINHFPFITDQGGIAIPLRVVAKCLAWLPKNTTTGG